MSPASKRSLLRRIWLLLALCVPSTHGLGEPVALDPERPEPGQEHAVQLALNAASALGLLPDLTERGDTLQLVRIMSGTEQVVAGVRYRVIVEAGPVPAGCGRAPCTLRDKVFPNVTFVCDFNGRGPGEPNGYLHYIVGDAAVGAPRPPAGSGTHTYAFFTAPAPPEIVACGKPSSSAVACPACASIKETGSPRPARELFCTWSAVGPLEQDPSLLCGSEAVLPASTRGFFALDFVDRPWERPEVELLSFGEVTFSEPGLPIPREGGLRSPGEGDDGNASAAGDGEPPVLKAPPMSGKRISHSSSSSTAVIITVCVLGGAVAFAVHRYRRSGFVRRMLGGGHPDVPEFEHHYGL